MYELIQVGPQSYYIESPAKTGIYRRNDTDVYLIDSGNDKEAGKKILKIVSQNNWTVKGIINTHSNADHIGGNNHIQKITGCSVFANGIEAAFTNYPILEPSFLYGGFPCKELRTKFLMAKESVATGFSSPGFPSEFSARTFFRHDRHPCARRDSIYSRLRQQPEDIGEIRSDIHLRRRTISCDT